MDKRCESCSAEFQERYNTAVRRFDHQIQICTVVTIIAICSAIVSFLVTAFCVVKTLEFINGFEYVEEEQTLVEQDGSGQNIAVLIDQSGA